MTPPNLTPIFPHAAGEGARGRGLPRTWLKADRAPRAKISEGFCQMGRLKKVPSGRGKNYLPVESATEPLVAHAAERSDLVVS